MEAFRDIYKVYDSALRTQRINLSLMKSNKTQTTSRRNEILSIAFHNQPQFHFHCRFHWSCEMEKRKTEFCGEQFQPPCLNPLAFVKMMAKQLIRKVTFQGRFEIHPRLFFIASHRRIHVRLFSPWWNCFSVSLRALDGKLLPTWQQQQKCYRMRQ